MTIERELKPIKDLLEQLKDDVATAQADTQTCTLEVFKYLTKEVEMHYKKIKRISILIGVAIAMFIITVVFLAYKLFVV
jgi:hypothetical protein